MGSSGADEGVTASALACTSEISDVASRIVLSSTVLPMPTGPTSETLSVALSSCFVTAPAITIDTRLLLPPLPLLILLPMLLAVGGWWWWW